MCHQLGLVSVSFRKHTPEQILQAMQQAGLGFIEWGSDVHAPCQDGQRLQELVALQNRYGIRCCSYGTYFRLGTDSVEELPQYIQAAAVLGTKILRLWCGSKNSQDYTPQERDALFAQCVAAARIAEAHDVVFCMECHNNTYTNCKEGALELMQAVDSPHFRMYWQPNQYRSVEENMTSARLLAPYTVNLHVFNWEADKQFPLAEAVPVWRAYVENFPGTHALLLEFMPDGRIESLQTEAASLKQLEETK